MKPLNGGLSQLPESRSAPALPRPAAGCGATSTLGQVKPVDAATRLLIIGLLVVTGGTSARAEGFTPDAEYRAMRGLEAINAEAAYVRGYSGKGVKIGIFDSGIDITHEEFVGQAEPGYNSSTGGPAEANGDTDGHGMGVAGLAAAARNGRGIQGVAYAATLVPFTSETQTPANQLPTPGNVADDARVLDRARALGVMILGNSWGYDQPDPPLDPTDPAAVMGALGPFLEAAQRYVDANGLLLFAAGNAAGTDAEPTAALPTLFPTLQRGWLAVVATNQAGTALAGYSNQCGWAKAYCLAAPGSEGTQDDYLVAPDLDDAYQPFAGTSAATPIAAGAAALASEAYPWMTGHQLQQTLLTTAADLGAPGIDDVYGWGLLDVGRAVGGPAQFTDDWLADVTPGRFVFANDISGVGGLVKAGPGTLVLGGNGTYAGDTVVQEGTLVVNGSLASSVDVAPAGTLGGSGTLSAALANAGTVAPGNSIGTLTVGSYTAAPGSTLLIEFDPANGSSDVLDVTGNATLNGTLSLIPVGPPAPRPRLSLAPLLVGGVIAGNFASLDVQGYSQLVVTPTLGAAGVSLEVDATRPDPAPLARTATQRRVGRVLGNADATRLGSFGTALAWTADADVPATLDALSGRIHAAAAWAALQAADPLRSQVLGNVLGADPVPPAGDVEGGDNGMRAWINPQYLETRVGAGGDNFPEVQSNGWGLSAGVDSDVRPGFKLGLAAAYLRLDTGFERGGPDRATADNGFLSAYGRLDLSGWQLAAIAGGGRQDIDSERRIDLGGLSQRPVSSRDGKLGFAGLELRRETRLGKGAWTLTPLVGVDATVQSLDSFSEAGGAAALEGKSETLHSLRTRLGVALAHGFQSDGRHVTVSLRPAWSHEWLDSGTRGELDASFAADVAAGSFRVDGARVGRDSLVVPVGLDLQLAEPLQLGLVYQGRFARNFAAQEGQIALRWSF